MIRGFYNRWYNLINTYFDALKRGPYLVVLLYFSAAYFYVFYGIYGAVSVTVSLIMFCLLMMTTEVEKPDIGYHISYLVVSVPLLAVFYFFNYPLTAVLEGSIIASFLLILYTLYERD